MAARHEVVRDRLVERPERPGGELLLSHRAAPADVAGVARPDLRQQRRTDGRSHPVRRHQQIADDPLAASGRGRRTLVGDVDRHDLGAHPVARPVQTPEEKAVERRPGGETETARRLAQHRGVGTEVAQPVHRSADLGEVGHAVVHQVAGGGRVENDPGAAALEGRGRAFQDLDLPTDVAQPQGSVESTEGAADHDRPAHRRPLPVSASTRR